MEVLFKELRQVRPPQYATNGSAAFDFYLPGDVGPIRIPQGAASVKVPLGIAIEVPKDHVMLLFSRSGHAANHSLRLSNCVGVIDPDYRGEVCALLTSDALAPDDGTPDSVILNPGDRVCQGMILPVPRVRFFPISELSKTERGDGGFGSTGGAGTAATAG